MNIPHFRGNEADQASPLQGVQPQAIEHLIPVDGVSQLIGLQAISKQNRVGGRTSRDKPHLVLAEAIQNCPELVTAFFDKTVYPSEPSEERFNIFLRGDFLAVQFWTIVRHNHRYRFAAPHPHFVRSCSFPA